MQVRWSVVKDLSLRHLIWIKTLKALALGIAVNIEYKCKVVGREGFEPSTLNLGKNVKSLGFDFLGKLGFESKVVGREGFEPSTNWLKANCSTN